ncbi:MAG: endonuclease/exonuclease/phosphatase family protein [Candidatus Hodarchaeota archaeon]
MNELLGSVNPRITDDLYGILFPAGMMTLLVNVVLLSFFLLFYGFSIWLHRDYLKTDLREKKVIGREIALFYSLGTFLTPFSVLFSLNMLIKSYSYLLDAFKAKKDGSSLKKKKFLLTKAIFLSVFLTVLLLAFAAIPIAIYYAFTGYTQTSFYISYISGTIITVMLNVWKKPSNLPRYKKPWHPAVKIRKIFNLSLVLVPIILGLTFVLSGFLKIHLPAPSGPTTTEVTNLKLISYNIRYGIVREENPANNWENRKDEFVIYLNNYTADIIGVQEAYSFQLDYIKKNLVSSAYKYTGFGRDDGVHGGEHAAIFFDSTKFNFIDGDTFWLSDYPLFPSKTWGDSNYRVCTWARFKVIENDAQFCVFNTHYATSGHYDTFHEPASRLIKQKIDEYSGGLPVFLMGDFNMRNSTSAFDLLENYGGKALSDTYDGNKTTSNSWDPSRIYGSRIDFILISSTISIINCSIEQDTYGSGLLYSDHYPVVLNCTF